MKLNLGGRARQRRREKYNHEPETEYLFSLADALEVHAKWLDKGDAVKVLESDQPQKKGGSKRGGQRLTKLSAA